MFPTETIREFGWLGVLIIWAIDKLFPRLWTFLTDKLFPARAQERAQKLAQELEIEEEAAKAKRESEAILLKAKIEHELREEEHRRKIEERMVVAQEETAKNIQQMTLAITVNNERLGQVAAFIDKLNSFTVEAVTDMRENVAKLHKRDTQQKVRVVRRAAK